MSAEIDKKPNTHITLKFSSQKAEQEVYFRVRRSCMLKTVMDAYCLKYGLKYDECRFLVDGDRVDASLTPDQMGLEDEDEIDVHYEMLGGALFGLI